MKIEKTDQIIKPAGRGTPTTERVAAYRVTFDAHEAPFLIAQTACTNPDCPCREVVLDFYEHGASQGTEPLSFGMVLDVDTGQEPEPESRGEHEQELVDEFLRDLPDEHKTDLRRVLDDRKDHAHKARAFTMPVDAVLSGEMTPYSCVFSDLGSILEGGQGSSFTFTVDGTTYYAEDTYCPSPSCDCNAVQLVYMRADGDVLEETCAITVALSGKVKDVKLASVSKKEALRVHRAWLGSEHGLQNELAHRYAEFKAIGARILDEEFEEFGDEVPPRDKQPKRIKVGRNAPCPCGSGKKYKKCCLLKGR